jgi:hypothetical protein
MHRGAKEGHAMSNVDGFNRPAHYRIRVSGALAHEQVSDLGPLAVIPGSGDETLLVGSVADQWALHGILARISDLGLGLLSLHRAQAGSAAEHTSA